jgi:hypothetical protein
VHELVGVILRDHCLENFTHDLLLAVCPDVNAIKFFLAFTLELLAAILDDITQQSALRNHGVGFMHDSGFELLSKP